MKLNFKTFTVFFFFLNTSCGGSSGIGKLAGAEPSETDAVYRVTFTSLWNAADHISLPGNAHFSPLVYTVHKSDHRLFSVGDLSSPGLESLAETGSVGSIVSEIEADVSRGSVLRSKVESDLFPSPGNTSLIFDIAVNEDFPMVSFVTMIAPSPDWVVGQDGVELYKTSTGFVEDSGVIELFAYNAGTEEGDTGGNYSLGGADTNPKMNMVRLTGSGFEEPFATIQFVKIQ